MSVLVLVPVVDSDNCEPMSFVVKYTNGVLMGTIYKEVDGYYVFAPELRGGFWDEHVLQDLFYYLQDLNEEWHKQIMKEIGDGTT
jgi:hypothetical protein